MSLSELTTTTASSCSLICSCACIQEHLVVHLLTFESAPAAPNCCRFPRQPLQQVLYTIYCTIYYILYYITGPISASMRSITLGSSHTSDNLHRSITTSIGAVYREAVLEFLLSKNGAFIDDMAQASSAIIAIGALFTIHINNHTSRTYLQEQLICAQALCHNAVHALCLIHQ